MIISELCFALGVTPHKWPKKGKFRAEGKNSLDHIKMYKIQKQKQTGWRVCQFVSRLNRKITGFSFIKLHGRVQHGPRKNPLNVGLHPRADAQVFFYVFAG